MEKHWINTYYVYEIFLFITGITMISTGYDLEQTLYNHIGTGMFTLGTILSFMQKKKG